MAMPRLWQIPERLTVRPDGSWRIGDLLVTHPPTLRCLKSHLVFEPETGRFQCVVGNGRAQSLPSRPAHHTRLAHVEQENGQFFLQAGERRLAVRA